MDLLVRHWAPFPRRFPSPFAVVTCSFIRKEDWVRQTFRTCNFSLILQGRGEFRRPGGESWPVQAPCVITQWPGEFVEYGPPPSETWDELYITYDAKLMSRFRQCRFVDPKRPVWPIADPAALREEIGELERLSRSAIPEMAVDRVDRLCERMVLETLLAPTGTREDGNERAIRAVIDEVRRQPGRFVDFEETAARHGMSPSTFRRRWAAVSKEPPGRYLQQLRMREARRLLVETRLPIHEIARAVGFQDELYFSRRFRKETQMAPRDYRAAHQLRRAAV